MTETDCVIPFESLTTNPNDWIIVGDEGAAWPVWRGVESLSPMGMGRMLARHALTMRIRTSWGSRDEVYALATQAAYSYKPPGAWARVEVRQEPSMNADFEACADTSIRVESISIQEPNAL